MPQVLPVLIVAPPCGLAWRQSLGTSEAAQLGLSGMNQNEMIVYKTVRNELEAISISRSFKQLSIGQRIVEARGGT